MQKGTNPRAPGAPQKWTNSQNIDKIFTCIKITQIITLTPTLGYLDYLGGLGRGPKTLIAS